MDAIQLDLFGDYPSLIDHDYDIKEQENQHEQELSDDTSGGSLEEIPPENVQGPQGQGPSGGTTDESGRGLLGSVWGDDRGGNSPARGSGDPAPAVHPTRSGTGLRGTDDRPGTIDSSLPRPPDTLRNNYTDDLGNFHIDLNTSLVSKGKVSKFEDNFAAISLLKNLENQGRYATPDEQLILARYTGWGGIAEAFSNRSDTWKDRQSRLEELLTPEEYKSASKSTQYAHYTPNEVVNSVWNAVRKMGYTGGPTLEPAIGTGNFFGLKPDNLPVEMYGIEQDSISGRIAKQLYQKAHIEINGYQNIRIEKDYYNLAISNVPFSDFKPYESREVRTPGMDKQYSLHDFYFLKSLHGVKPGGMVTFITSRYTMDKEDTEVREKIAMLADFTGAIRLPDTSFRQIANTEVVTDIVFLRKRHEHEVMSELTRTFVATGEITLTTDTGEPVALQINQYYLDNPEMVIGKQNLTGTMYAANQYNVTLEKDISAEKYTELLNKAVELLPENIFSIIEKNTHDINVGLNEYLSHINVKNISLGAYVIGSDDKLYQKTSMIKDKEFTLSKYYNPPVRHADIEKVKDLVRIKDCLKAAVASSFQGDEIEAKQQIEQLNTLYDSFVVKNGFISKRNNIRLMTEDPEHNMLTALENWNSKTKTAIKTDIFSGISVARSRQVDRVDTPAEALAVCLSQYGTVNIPYMASVAGMSKEELTDDLLSQSLVFEDPEQYLRTGNTTYLTSDEYLCGNIRWKLQKAKEAVDRDPVRFNANVSALEAIIPRDLGPEEINVKINSPVVGDRYVKEFINELLESDLRVIHIRQLGKWEVRGYAYGIKNSEIYGTERIEAKNIVELILNNKPIRVYDRVGDPGKETLVLNQDETTKAEMKAREIKNRFQQWIWSDTDRTEDICRRYNDTYNCIVNRKYVHPQRRIDEHAEIYFPGCAFPYPARANQADAVWRCLQNSDNMLAHAVGAGKTLEIIWSAMEMKRLGIRNKPMIVVPNHMIEQWTAEFREAYPQSKLLVAIDKNFNADERQTFVNKIATGDWDAVIIKNSHFKMIPLSPEKETDFLNKKVEEYKEILDYLDRQRDKSRSRKEVERAVEKYEERLKMLSDQPKDAGVFYFDQLGVDQLFVDEADIFKNLEYYTQMQNIRGMGTPTGSGQAFDLYMKVQVVQQCSGGVTFATGTPISNTLVEAYTMQRYLQPETLAAQGIQAFDEWARQYADTVTQMELNNTGTGYRPVTRFSKIVNVPELMASLNEAWDIQTADNLEENGILVQGKNLPYKKTINLSASSTPLLKSFLSYLEQREKNLTSDRHADNVLKIISDGKKAAIDLRMIDTSLPDDPESKLNVTVDKIEELYRRYEKQRYLTVVFFDEPNSHSGFHGIDVMCHALIQRGVKPEEIADIRSCNNDLQKREMFTACNEGKYRVLFGSTRLMGAGTNIQKRLKALIHMDAPWRPRDIEQRNGRAFRPGNMVLDFYDNGNCITPEGSKGTVELYNVVTKGSLDTGLWNVLETKDKSIKQIMQNRDKSTREIEEDYYGSVKELSIDNPLMKEAVELQHDLKKLHSMQNAHNSMVATAKRYIQTLPGTIERKIRRIESIEADLSVRSPYLKGDAFYIEIRGETIKKRKEAGEMIIGIGNSLRRQAKEKNHREVVKEKIGKYAGFDIGIEVSNQFGEITPRLVAYGKYQYSTEFKKEPDPVGLINSFNFALYKQLDEMNNSATKEIENCKKSLAEYRVLVEKKFEHNDEIVKKEIRQKEVIDLLAKENEKQKKTSVSFPWNTLSEMSFEKIREACEEFNRAVSISVVPQELEITIETVEDIRKDISEQFSITLPHSILEKIQENSTAGTVDLGKAHLMICETIRGNEKVGYSWEIDVPEAGDYARYGLSNDKMNNTIVVRRVEVSGKESFEAYRIQSGHEKYLGAESSFDAMKKRVEQYVVCLNVRDKVNDSIKVEKKPVISNCVYEKRESYGIEI